MNKFINLISLNDSQKFQYKDAINKAFPPIIGESQVIKKYWSKLETYYPENQFLLISNKDELIGFINTVPFHFDKELDHLPERGWDWMLSKGIADFENKIEANYLGGLQVIVRKEFQSQGFSRKILNYAKNFIANSNFKNLIIPIRPTQKHKFPELPMSEYLNLKSGNEVFDPWIRTHLKGGAQIIKICEKSMMMAGDIEFWERILEKKIYKTGKYILRGALSLITIDLEKDKGEYIEPNIWIKY